MARIAEMERRLLDWAAWKAWNDRPQAAIGRALVQAGDAEDAQFDTAIALLPSNLALALAQVYRRPGNLCEHARQLGCAEATVVRRIGRAHRLLHGILATRRERAAREEERSSMRARLAAGK